MTALSDTRGQRLRSYDAHAADFARECAESVQAGARIASTDLDLMMELACGLAASARAWAALVSRLDLAAAAPLDPQRAAAITLETVFEETLTPSAWRVLASGLDLALCLPAGGGS
jgi:hypothetical protein